MEKKTINILKKLGAVFLINKLHLVRFFYSKRSYSQFGEDIIISHVLNAMNVRNIFYVDIGACHPFSGNNTAFFYNNGSNGICIEPDPTLFKTIKRYRKRDFCLNIGVGGGMQKKLDFFVFSEPALNTFSQDRAERLVKEHNYKIIKKIKIPVLNINEIIDKFAISKPNLISIDAEGLDFEILKTFNFEKYRPEVFCVETITFDTNNSGEKVKEIIDYMLEQNYLVYADTHANTIFVEKDKWKSIKQRKGSVTAGVTS